MKTRLSESEAEAEEPNQSQSIGTCIVIGLSSPLLLPTLTIWFSLDHKQNISNRDVRQHAKKVVSDSPGLVDFTVGLVNSAVRVIPLFCTVHPLLRMTLRHPRWRRFFPLVRKEQARAAFADLKLLFTIKCRRLADSFLVCYRKTRK